MSLKILLIEDEPGLVRTVRDLLTGSGYAVTAAADGESGLRIALGEDFDLVLLDLMLPGKDGFEVCRELRESGRTLPVLMLTARGQVTDRVKGLRLGADDYLAKPFDPDELLARVEALLRRSGKLASEARIFRFGSIEVDFDRATVLKNGETVALAAKELQLLQYLIDHRDRIVTRDELMENIWKYSNEIPTRTVDVHIAWLRQKLEDEPQLPAHILTVRGRGYRFEV